MLLPMARRGCTLSFDLSMRIPHPVILQQMSAQQPRLLVVLLWLFAAGWLLSLLSHLFMLVPVFPKMVIEQDLAYSVYTLVFWVMQLSVTCAGIAFLSSRYASATLVPQPSWGRVTAGSLLVLGPLLLMHLGKSVHSTYHLLCLPSWYGPEASEAVASIFYDTWERLPYGVTVVGVSCSLASFVFVVLEELVFTGFLFNIIGARYGLGAALLATPTCFTLAHTFSYGFGEHLVNLFFASLTYVMLRVLSGSLLLAVAAHWTINALIFLPKWVVAAMYFTGL
jgi:membrane protease YdiL (CAAX protease family)